MHEKKIKICFYNRKTALSIADLIQSYGVKTEFISKEYELENCNNLITEPKYSHLLKKNNNYLIIGNLKEKSNFLNVPQPINIKRLESAINSFIGKLR